LRQAGAGDTVLIPAGSFQADNYLEIPGGVTLRGVSGTADANINIPGLPRFYVSASKLQLNVSGNYGIRMANDAKSVTISDLDINATGGAIGGLSGRIAGINITRNAISAHGLHAMRVNYATYLNVSDNYFHNGNGADRSFEGW